MAQTLPVDKTRVIVDDNDDDITSENAATFLEAGLPSKLPDVCVLVLADFIFFENNLTWLFHQTQPRL